MPFLSAPHRLMFATGLGLALLGMLLWLVDVSARFAGLWAAPIWPVAPSWWHGALMLYGVFPCFIFGFLMTALPKWVSAPALRPIQYLPAWGGLLAGWLLFFLGLLAVSASLLAVGLAVVAFGWGWGAWQIFRACRWPQPVMLDRRHAHAAVAALSLGWLGLVAQALGMLTPLWPEQGWLGHGVEWAEALGLWGCLLPIFAIVSHRMLPFFTGAAVQGYVVYRPMPLLWVWLTGLVGHGVAELLRLPWLLLLADGVVVAVAGWCVWRWWRGAGAWGRAGMGRILQVPLVAVLHVANLWLVLGMLLQFGSDLRLLAGLPGWGLAPLHALGVGYFGSLVLGMATRVTLGHSGRMLTETVGLVWPLFLAYQLVPVLRVLGEFVYWPGLGNLYVWAGLGWLGAFALWGWAHAGMYFRARPDGQPG